MSLKKIIAFQILHRSFLILRRCQRKYEILVRLSEMQYMSRMALLDFDRKGGKTTISVLNTKF